MLIWTYNNAVLQIANTLERKLTEVNIFNIVKVVLASIGMGLILYAVVTWHNRWQWHRPSKNERLVALALLRQGSGKWSGFQLMCATGLGNGTIHKYTSEYRKKGWLDWEQEPETEQAESELPMSEWPPRKTYYWLTPQGVSGVKALLEFP